MMMYRLGDGVVKLSVCATPLGLHYKRRRAEETLRPCCVGGHSPRAIPSEVCEFCAIAAGKNVERRVGIDEVLLG